MGRKQTGLASIIIRSRNEERWINHCLKAVFGQNYPAGYEVIVVDNKSTDNTLKLVESFPIKEVKTIHDYLPGKALNMGIESASGDFIICLSAHCIPKRNDWLEKLLRNFEQEQTAGVYGRQLPVSFSSLYDVRDLTITFGLDRRVQTKDAFFHNANSAIRKDMLRDCPFNEEVPNIEDRLWATEIIKQGYQIIYEPDGEVFHHHGIHHNNSPKRAESTISVLNAHENLTTNNSLPDTMKPGQLEVATIIPVPKEVSELLDIGHISALIDDISSNRYLKTVYVLYDDPTVKSLAEKAGAKAIQRDEEANREGATLEDALAWGLDRIEEMGSLPEAVLYVNPLYVFCPEGLFDLLVEDFCYKGLDTVFAGYADYQNYWIYDQEKGYREFGEGTLPRGIKHPAYKAVFGLGCITYSGVIRTGKLTGERVGIIPVDDIKYTLKASDPSSMKLIKLLGK